MLTRTVIMAQIGAAKAANSLVSRYQKPFKAVNLLEYALLALISIGLFVLIAALFRTQIAALITKITGGITTGTGSTGL
jgi:hypothetical protein